MTGATILRLCSALAAGAALALVWGMAAHGVGHVLLGRAAEPEAGQAPLRWPALPDDRPARVLLLGTSLTQGGDWSATLAAQLSACRAGGSHGAGQGAGQGGVQGGVQVERLARPGANSGWGAAALAERLAVGGGPPDAIPDVIVAEFSINDASLWHGVSLARSRALHEEILATAAGAGIPVWLATMSPAFGREAWERPGQVAYRALYADLARAQGVGLIATVPAWTALSPADRAASLPDGLHPSDAAMVRIAVPALTKALRPLLCPAG